MSEVAVNPLSAETRQELADMPQVGCPMNPFLEMLTRPWTLHILWQLSQNGPMRFGALRRSIDGISARLLTVRLRTLEDEGFVRRTVIGGKVPEVTYTPTSRLADMNGFMEHLHGLAAKWHREDAEAGKLTSKPS